MRHDPNDRDKDTNDQSTEPAQSPPEDDDSGRDDLIYGLREGDDEDTERR